MDTPSGSNFENQNNMLGKTQQQVNEVVDIMRVNVEKVLERDETLSDLHRRGVDLHEGGKIFLQQAQKLKGKYWWKNFKMMIILGVIGAILLIIIVLSVILNSANDDKTKSPSEEAVTAGSGPN